jgi:hypothetical protein
MTKDEALELCDYLEGNDASLEAQCKAAAFIREALAQPAQEPVAWMTQARNFVNLMEFTEAEAKLYGWTPVYIAPPAAPVQEPVGSLNITSYKGLGNYDFDYVGQLPDGTYSVYTTPPAAPKEQV